ncbi:hypothetical protein [Streptomyces sp. VRA16 Mangrove soil]|uniref:hypothetical protein n=1 Tax=Streptomyces sp. VRA16 Mangrove soil TaxID=2817434 RepID=UPI001A9F360E|nr:hypothetical protein [Streptomyces sp. VRA16 Mangrove soil]MBO1337256.1 hypothetical protein [Streptomyces sp. VRA16 Mangrove soil]
MWPGEQGPGDGTHPPQDRASNPYLQPGYHQQQPWNSPTQPGSSPPPPSPGRGRRTAVVAVAAGAAVVVAACVTGVLLIGRDGGDDPAPGPTGSGRSTRASPTESGDPRRGGGVKATVKGWKPVVNPNAGVAFDVPAQWALKSEDWVTSVGDPKHPDSDALLIGMRAPAFLKEKWCSADSDRDGTKDDWPLGFAGSRGGNGARTPQEAARRDAADWVYGMYAQRRDQVHSDASRSYTTASGLTGTLASASSDGVAKKDRCTTEGKATTFSFQNPDGDILSWSFVGPAGVKDEVPDATIRRILATMRLVDTQDS